MRSLVELRFDDDADRDDPVVQTFLARIPEARRLHAARGLTEEESWQTLRDLPRHARLDRLLHGTPGLRKEWWVELAFSGRLFQVGRLQFEPRDGYLAVHIPEEGGPLTPAAVDASLARARELFLIAGTSEPDEPLLRALVAAALEAAKARGKRLSIEADEANEELWRILDELPAVLEPELLVLATDR